MRGPLALIAALAPLAACDAGAPTDPEGLGSNVLDLVLDPEQPADVPVIGGVGTASSDVQVAWSGTRYLAAWVQEGPTGAGGVYFARIAADGTLIDAPGVRLVAGTTPAVAFFTGFLVALNGSDSIELWRVGQQGVVSFIGWVGPTNRSAFPDIAAGASEAMIVHNDILLSEGRIFATRYDGNGLSPVQIGNNVPRDARPKIAYRPGGDYLAVWENELGNVRGRFVSPAASPGLAFAISSAEEVEGAPAVAFAGSSYLVAWRALVPGGVQIRAALVSPTGEVSPPVDVSSVMAVADSPSVSCDTACTVLWSGGADPTASQLWGRRLGGDLNPLGDEAIAVGGPSVQGPGELAGTGSAQYLVWVDGQSGIVDAYGSTASIDGDGGLALGAPTLLPLGDVQQDRPAVAASSAQWLVGWDDTRNGGLDLFGRRFGFDGIAKGPRARPIHERAWLQNSLTLAGGDSQFLAAWYHFGPQGEREMRATRIEASGAVLDPAGVKVGTSGLGSNLDVAAGGDGGWLVAWERDTGLVDRIHAAVVRPDGTSTAPLDLTTTTGHPKVAYDPDANVYLVIWSERPNGAVGLVRAVRVAADGSAALDPAPVTLATITSFPDADIAFGAGAFLVVLEEDDRVLGLRVALGAGGIEVLDPVPFPLDPAPGHQLQPAVTFTAKGFLVAYERWESGGTYDIHGVQVSPDGIVQGSAFVLTDGPEAEMRPAFAGASGRRALLAFRRLSDNVSTVFVRRLVIGFPDGATCTDDAQCESGLCDSGVCAPLP